MYKNNYNKYLNAEELSLNLKKFSTQLNIQKWDFGASSSKDISVQIQKGEPKQLKGSQRNSITIRVWNDQNQVGITSTSDLSNNGLNKALKVAFEASLYGNKEESPEFSPLAQEKLAESITELSDQSEIDQLVQIMKQAESNLISKHESIESVPYNGLSENYVERIYINSDGAIRQMQLTQSSIYLYAQAQEKGRKPRSSGSIKIANGINNLDISSCIEEAANRTISHLNYKPINTRKYLVCFMPEAFLQLINAFSSIFNARSILDGVSLISKDSIGRKIAIPEFSLSDESLHPSNIGAFLFDGEGTPTQNINIIDSGKLINLIHSEATARKFGVSPTGHAGIGAKVSVSPDWLVVKKSSNSDTLDSQLNTDNFRKEYILIEGLSALHSGVKSSQGSFSLPFDGWLVNNGEKTSIEAATIAGDILKVLENIVNIEDKQIVTHQGISPHIWVDNMSIAGEA